MDPFRTIIKARIKDGNLEEYLSIVQPIVKIVNATEPNALQYEAFVNRDNQTVIWLESYNSNSDFEFHLTNPAFETLKNKGMQLTENFDFVFMSPPTEATFESLQQSGIHPLVLDPWPGTIRLGEVKRNGHNLQSYVTVDLTDMDAYRDISQRVEAAAATHPGVLFHRSYQIDDSRIAAYEEYADSQTVLDWVGVFAATASDFGSLVKGMTYEVCGTPSPECKAILDGWGAVYYEKVDGFSRFT